MKKQVILIIILLLVVFGIGTYHFNKTNTELESTIKSLNESREKIAALEKQNEELGGTLTLTKTQNEELGGELARQKEQNEELEEENEDLEEERELLEKLVKTDKQLLAKYSKVYFLNENYSPVKLGEINSKYTLPKGKVHQFLEPAIPYLEELLEDAEKDGIDLRIISSYRSFTEQQALKSNYKVIYGAGTANSFSADQGYSEHQLGTTVDFTTPTLVAAAPSFANTKAFTWLQNNAHKYGFILSYPRSNSYYIYEPWHWRFVGEDLAEDLYAEKKNFYDLDQRKIDEYLIKIFD